MRAEGLRGLHSFTSAVPLLGPGARVQTVHELPWRHGEPENAGWRHRAWAAVGPWRADRVVCPTQLVARDLARHASVDARRIRVVPWGVGPPFRAEESPDDDERLARLGVGPDPFVLCPGGARPKKNLAALLRGAARLTSGPGAHLEIVVTGERATARTPDRDGDLATRLGMDLRTKLVGDVDDATLATLLRRASLVALLSRSEGFGLPVLEAFASGTPVLVPHGTAQAEVAGELAFLVRTDDPDDVARGLTEALARGPTLRATLIAFAGERTWDATARMIEALWEELA